MLLISTRYGWILQVRYKIVAQVEEFKYLRILLTRMGEMEQEIGRWIGAVSGVIYPLYQSVRVKSKLAGMSFLHRVFGLSLRDGELGHLSKMPSKHLHGKVH